ncbi:MAG: hypothetical protein JW850_11575 [Thermoflexales bacterium]|nr:hypothetical protein [Thermoflexales bacterium]
MKVGRRRTAPGSNAWGWVGVLALVLVVAWIVSQVRWRPDVWRVPSLSLRPAPAGELPTLTVDMRFANYNDLLSERERALQSGVYIPSAQDFVTATLRMDEALVPVRMRLLPGLAERLGEDDKWGFDVRTRGGAQLLGMQRFYLVDPAANNWLNEWAFVRSLEREDVLATRYQFVRLVFNGDDRGTYALQEGFGSELLKARGRQAGVIVEFDTDLLWKSIAHFQGDARAAYADPISKLSAADFQYFEVDTFRDATIADSPELSSQKDQAIGLLRALQAGELKASEAFDVERYGRFLALVDLWGASQAVSLVNLRYYFDPLTARLEPVAFNANPLSKGRLSLAAAFGDPAIQAAYARELARVSQAGYLDQLQVELEPELEQWRQRLNTGGLDQELAPPWDALRARQEQIRRSLEPVQPVFAYLGSPAQAMSGTLRVEVGNILNLPVEILGFDIGGATFVPAERGWLAGGAACLLSQDDGTALVLRALDTARAPVICYTRFDIPLATIQGLDSELDGMHELELRLAARILGLSTTHMVPARQGYPDVLRPE